MLEWGSKRLRSLVLLWFEGDELLERFWRSFSMKLGRLDRLSLKCLWCGTESFSRFSIIFNQSSRHIPRVMYKIMFYKGL